MSLGRQRLVLDISNSLGSIGGEKESQNEKGRSQEGDICYVSSFLPVYFCRYLVGNSKNKGGMGSMGAQNML